MTMVLWGVAIIVAVAVLVGACFTRKPVRALMSSALQGICALAAVNVISVFTGVTLGVTAFSVAMCCVLGIPGTATLLVMQVLFANG